jgi:hypothetical protein
MLPKTINRLVNEAIDEGKDPGQYVADIVQQEQNIKLKIGLRRNDLDVIQKEYNKKKTEIHRQIIEIRSTCPHLEFTFFNDPSGGNDSHHSCDWCGKEW